MKGRASGNGERGRGGETEKGKIGASRTDRGLREPRRTAPSCTGSGVPGGNGRPGECEGSELSSQRGLRRRGSQLAPGWGRNPGGRADGWARAPGCRVGVETFNVHFCLK